MRSGPLPFALAASLVLGLLACSSSDSNSAPVIESASGASAAKAQDGSYSLVLHVTAHDDGKIATARIDFPSSDPASYVGEEQTVDQASLSDAPLTFPLEAKLGPGTGDANLVLTDDKGATAKKKIIVTLP